jgi:hypothetical protein
LGIPADVQRALRDRPAALVVLQQLSDELTRPLEVE